MSDPNQPGYPPQGSPYPSGAPGQGQPRPHEQPAQPSETKLRFSLGQVLGAILFVLLVIFIVENSSTVEVRIIAGPKVHPPLWVAILIAAVLGALISELLRYRRRVGARRKAQLREHKAAKR